MEQSGIIQSDIIHEMTVLFSNKLNQVFDEEENGRVVIENNNPGANQDEQIIRLVLLGLEYADGHNVFEKIQLKKKENGRLIEYFVTPSMLISLKYAVTPFYHSIEENQKVLGKIIRVLNDENLIIATDYDWIGNAANPIRIENSLNMDLYKQMHIFSMLKLDYRPSLFYQLIVGISSAKEEVFGRVEEHKVSTFKMKAGEDLKAKPGKNTKITL